MPDYGTNTVEYFNSRVLVNTDSELYNDPKLVIKSVDFPLLIEQRWDSIPSGNIEDLLWMSLIDYTSEAFSANTGVAITQSILLCKLHSSEVILAKYGSVVNDEGEPELYIGIGNGVPDSKETPPVIAGNRTKGITINSALTLPMISVDEALSYPNHPGLMLHCNDKLYFSTNGELREVLLGGILKDVRIT